MRRALVCMCAGMLALASGCRTSNTRIGGVVKKGTTDHVFVELDDTTIDDDDLTRQLFPGEIVETPDFIYIEVDHQGPDDAFVLVGPRPGSGMPATFRLGSLYLYEGWAISSGSWPPAITTGWVSAAARGTTFAVRFDSATGHHRIYLLRKTSSASRVEITCRSNPMTFIIGDECGYIELDASCNPVPPGVGSSPTGDVFVDEFKEYLQAVGWNEPKLGPDHCGLNWTP